MITKDARIQILGKKDRDLLLIIGGPNLFKRNGFKEEKR